jgi:diguanylate cyclase (GGDEF)-like protein
MEGTSLNGDDPYLKHVRKQLVDPAHADNKLLAVFQEFAERYEAMRRTLVRTVRIADDYQKRLQEANRKLDEAMRTDYLTGLLNRRAFYDRLEAELARSRRHSRPTCILMCDVDHFKSVNDKYGHDVGDLVLKEIASSLKFCLRNEDLKVRWGGEEFLALISETDVRGAAVAAEKFRAYVESKELESAGSRLRVTVSIGVTEFGSLSPEEAIKEADQALYEAKNSGRNKVVLTSAHVAAVANARG